MQPRNTGVLIAEINTERMTDSGVIVPSATSNEYKVAEIVAVGPGRMEHKDEINLARDLEPGQIVLVKVASRRRVARDYVGFEGIGVNFRTPDGRDIKMVDELHVVGIFSDEDIEAMGITDPSDDSPNPKPSPIVTG